MMKALMAKPQSYVARSQYPVPVSELFAWHERPGAFERLSPPWEDTELVERTGGLEVGARTVVRVPVAGPVKQTLVAEHTAYAPGELFQDTQREGPFHRWVHTHRMRPLGPDRSELEDAIEYELPLGAAGRWAGGRMVRARLERMFAYRHEVTRLDLERHARWSKGRPLHVAVTGASGLVGSALVPFLQGGGHRVTRLVRSAPKATDEVQWDPDGAGLNPAALEGVDAVVHLASSTVSRWPWTDAVKAEIRDSRVRGTRLIAEALGKMSRPPRVLVCASGISFYGSQGDTPLTEQSPKGEGFLSDVVEAWEAAARPARDRGIRVVSLRIGMVLSPRGGALRALLPVFRAGAGGRVASGTQRTPFISIEDVLGATLFALQTPELSGPVNAVSPVSVTNAEFTRTLAKVLKRPAVLPMPEVAVRRVLGQMGVELLLQSANLAPKALLDAGFTFAQPELEGALRFLLGR